MAADNELWAEAPDVVRLFPTFVWRCQLRPEIHQPINAAILKQSSIQTAVDRVLDFEHSAEADADPLPLLRPSVDHCGASRESTSRRETRRLNVSRVVRHSPAQPYSSPNTRLDCLGKDGHLLAVVSNSA